MMSGGPMMEGGIIEEPDQVVYDGETLADILESATLRNFDRGTVQQLHEEHKALADGAFVNAAGEVALLRGSLNERQGICVPTHPWFPMSRLSAKYKFKGLVLNMKYNFESIIEGTDLSVLRLSAMVSDEFKRDFKSLAALATFEGKLEKQKLAETAEATLVEEYTVIGFNPSTYLPEVKGHYEVRNRLPFNQAVMMYRKLILPADLVTWMFRTVFKVLKRGDKMSEHDHAAFRKEWVAKADKYYQKISTALNGKVQDWTFFILGCTNYIVSMPESPAEKYTARKMMTMNEGRIVSRFKVPYHVLAAFAEYLNRPPPPPDVGAEVREEVPTLENVALSIEKAEDRKRTRPPSPENIGAGDIPEVVLKSKERSRSHSVTPGRRNNSGAAFSE